METNQIPKINMDKSETGCCPKFNPEPWENQTLVFDKKKFVKVKTRNFFHIPLNMGSVFTKIWKKIEENKASEIGFLVLSYDPSAWTGEHFFAVDKDIPNEEMTTLSGTYLTKVFEGPYQDAGKWVKQMEEYIKNKDKKMKKLYFFYTTCPKCAKHYGKNYTVALAEI